MKKVRLSKKAKHEKAHRVTQRGVVKRKRVRIGCRKTKKRIMPACREIDSYPQGHTPVGSPDRNSPGAAIDETLSSGAAIDAAAIKLTPSPERLSQYDRFLRENLMAYVGDDYFPEGYLPTQAEIRKKLKRLAPLQIPKFDSYYADLVRQNQCNFYYLRMKDLYTNKTNIPPEYQGNLPSPIILVSAHGSYTVDVDMSPVDIFTANIKVFLYRSARPSCVTYMHIDGTGVIYELLKSIYSDDFTSKDIVRIVNNESCHPSICGGAKYIKMYTDFCYGKVDVLTYEPGDPISNKEFSFSLSTHSGVRIVCDSPYLSSQNLLLGIAAINKYSTRQIIETAQEHGATECHIVDFGCSLFMQDDVEISGDEKHIRAWEERKRGGRKSLV